MYVDFTHENSQIAVYAAMGLFNVSKALDPKKMEKKPEEREWVASRMVPFSGRMVVEKLTCRTADGLADSEGSRNEDGEHCVPLADFTTNLGIVVTFVPISKNFQTPLNISTLGWSTTAKQRRHQNASSKPSRCCYARH